VNAILSINGMDLLIPQAKAVRILACLEGAVEVDRVFRAEPGVHIESDDYRDHWRILPKPVQIGIKLVGNEQVHGAKPKRRKAAPESESPTPVRQVHGRRQPLLLSLPGGAQ
jgi:hypothetical protein